MIGRLCQEIPEDDTWGILRLLKVIIRMYERDLGTIRGTVHIDRILAERPAFVARLVDLAVGHMSGFEHPTRLAATLSRVTRGAVRMEDVARRVVTDFARGADMVAFTPDLLQKYELLGRCLCSSGPETAQIFERFMEIGEARPECRALLRAYTMCEVNEAQLRPSPYEVSLAEYQGDLRRRVAEEIAPLQRGENPELQGELAKLYWGLYSGESQNVRGGQLTAAIGRSLTRSVELGFVAVVSYQTPPTLESVAQSSAQNTLYWHWYAFLAGVDLLWVRDRDLSDLAAGTLSAALAFSLLIPTYDRQSNLMTEHVRDWPRWITSARPEIAAGVYATLLTHHLQQSGNVSHLLNRFYNEPPSNWQSDLAIELMTNREVTDQTTLRELAIVAAASSEGRTRLGALAAQRAEAHANADAGDTEFLIAIGFLLGLAGFEARLVAEAAARPGLFWTIKSLAGAVDRSGLRGLGFDLDVHQTERVICAFGPTFENATRPIPGWGDRTHHDAAMYLGGLITTLSTRPGPEAAQCLLRLIESPGLSSYHSWISSRLTAQQEVSRQSRYEKPTWPVTCKVLGGGPPANIEDLKALFLADLADASDDLRHSNVDRYRIFWSGDGSRLGKPRNEEFCRDRLLEYLRGRLAPMQVSAEPEGRMAAEKRADIVVGYVPNDLKLPVEVKRDYHKDLWTAARDQLGRLYATDRSASGHGVYLVLYFGASRGRGITPHPEGISISDSADALEKALNEGLPAAQRERITCVVVDVSPPVQGSARLTRKTPASHNSGGHRKKTEHSRRRKANKKRPAKRSR